MKKIDSFSEYNRAYEHSVNDPEGFWEDVASTFSWQSKWDKVLDWEFDLLM